TLDRISEIVVYIGILSLYNDYRLELGDVGMIYLIMLAMAGALMISYTRARAEALGLDCRAGLMPRAERGVLSGRCWRPFGDGGVADDQVCARACGSAGAGLPGGADAAGGAGRADRALLAAVRRGVGWSGPEDRDLPACSTDEHHGVPAHRLGVPARPGRAAR